VHRLALPALVALSFVDAAPGLDLPGRAGFLWAGLATLVLAAVRARALLALVRRERALAGAAAAFVAARLVAAIVSDAGLLAWADLARAMVCVLVAALALAEEEDLRDPLGWVGAAVLLALGASIPLGAFEIGAHAVAGALPRLHGWSAHPMACGVVALLALALTQGAAEGRLRAFGLVAGTILSALTASFAAACAALVVVARAPRLGRALAAAVVVLSLTVLWLHPLEVRALGATLLDRDPPAGWSARELGPTHQPIGVVDLGVVEATGFVTGYARLAGAALGCFRGAPLLGVGARDFPRDCPVMAMSSQGGWGADRDPHNAWLGGLAERGLLDLLVVLALVVVAARRGIWRAPPELTWALAACALAGFGGMRPLQIALAVLVGLALRRYREPA
jgi:hypothetical protein